MDSQYPGLLLSEAMEAFGNKAAQSFLAAAIPYGDLWSSFNVILSSIRRGSLVFAATINRAIKARTPNVMI
jgi:hypothetical protein